MGAMRLLGMTQRADSGNRKIKGRTFEELEKSLKAVRATPHKDNDHIVIVWVMNEQIIALNGLMKSYGKHQGISNLSFSINVGGNLRLHRVEWRWEIYDHLHVDGTDSPHRGERHDL